MLPWLRKKPMEIKGTAQGLEVISLVKKNIKPLNTWCVDVAETRQRNGYWLEIANLFSDALENPSCYQERFASYIISSIFPGLCLLVQWIVSSSLVSILQKYGLHQVVVA